MKCKVCGGTGVIQGQAPGLVSCCSACDGKGFIEMTNEEWFASLTTEEKAKVISKLDYLHGNVYEIEQWLKEIHHAN